MLALIDADIVAYRCAASAENDPLEIAISRAHDLMTRILHNVGAHTYKAFLTGDNNFRYTIYPQYKANRKGKPKPRHLSDIQSFLITEWNAKVTDGNEADDELGIEQTCANNSENTESIICTIDKDLLQVPGNHYNFVTEERRVVSPLEGTRYFYRQIITGDGSDNIPSYDGKVRHSVPLFIDKLCFPLLSLSTERELFDYVCSIYGATNSGLAIMNAKCLYIQRKENDFWTPPTKDGLSLQPSEPPQDDGLLNTTP